MIWDFSLRWRSSFRRKWRGRLKNIFSVTVMRGAVQKKLNEGALKYNNDLCIYKVMRLKLCAVSLST